MKHDIALANDLVVRSLLAKIERLEARLHRLENPPPKQIVRPRAQADRGQSDDPAFARLTAICRPFARLHGVTVSAMRGRDRSPHIRTARNEAVAACVAAGFSTPVVGRFFDGRDHATILHLIGRKGR